MTSQLTITFTWVDHANNRFITLARFGFKSLHDLEIAWKSVPERGDDDLLADLDRGDGMEDNKYVSADFIEKRTGRSLADMKAEGVNEVESFMAYMQQHFTGANKDA